MAAAAVLAELASIAGERPAMCACMGVPLILFLVSPDLVFTPSPLSRFRLRSQARLSNIVEAEVDCGAAMDILGFALYHENNQAPPTTEPNVNDSSSSDLPKRPLTPDSSVGEHGDDPSEEEEGASAKRQRLDAEKDSDPRTALKRRIWEELTKAKDGMLAIEGLCQDVADREEVVAAISEMEEQKKLMVADSIVVQVD